MMAVFSWRACVCVCWSRQRHADEEASMAGIDFAPTERQINSYARNGRAAGDDMI